MAQVVKCSRILPRYCSQLQRVAALSTSASSTTAGSSSAVTPAGEGGSGWRGGWRRGFPVLQLGAGFVLLGNIAAQAKEVEEEEEGKEGEELLETLEEDVTAAIAESLKEMDTDLMTDSLETQRYDAWRDVQQKYLLLSEVERKNIELRDVTAEELAEVDAAYEAGRMVDTEDKLLLLNTVSPHNAEVLWRLGRLKWIHGKCYNNAHNHKVFHLAHTLCLEALEANPECGDAHRWAAVTGYYRACKDGVKAGVYNLEPMKYHLEKAIELNPDDYQAWTILGNWHFEVAEMTAHNKRYCRWIARVEPPTSSYEKALECFQRSDSIQTWTQTSLFIALVHLRTGHYDRALAQFQTLLDTIVIKTVEDYRVRKTAHLYITKLTNPTLGDRIKRLIFSEHLIKYRIPIYREDNRSNFYNESVFMRMFNQRTY